MFAKKGRVIAFGLVLVFVTVLLIGGIVHLPQLVEADNESGAWHGHFEVVQTKYGFCGDKVTYQFYLEGGWLYIESCLIGVWIKARQTYHGVPQQPSCNCTPRGPDNCPCSSCYEHNCNYQN